MHESDDWGMFIEDGPWVLDRGAISWLPETPARRATALADMRAVIRPGLVPPASRAVVVATRLGAAVGAWQWHKRRRHFAKRGGSTADLSRRLRVAAEALGPTYIKLAQIISAGDGLFPPELVTEFRRCRDQVPSESFETVKRTVEEDLGRSLDEVFSSFDESPVAAASIAQVHAATLRSGEAVVVKVQRPTVARRVRDDLRVMAWLAPRLVGRINVASLANPPALVELFAETIVEELDFRIEAANMVELAEVLRKLDLDRYVVPRPHPTLVTRRVLVMERLSGFKFDDVAGMAAAGIDTEEVIRNGMVSFMEGALIHGVFHGDLHGGNLFVLPDGRTALLDFGIIGRLSEARRLAFMRLMVSAAINDVRGQVAALRDLGALPADTDLDAVIAELGLDRAAVDTTSLTGEQLVAEVQRLVKALLAFGAKVPKELMLYVKNLMFLDGAIATLAPDLDLLAEVTNISLTFTARHGERLGSELGIDPATLALDLTSVKAGLGLDAEADHLTYRELQERRQLIQKRMRAHATRR